MKLPILTAAYLRKPTTILLIMSVLLALYSLPMLGRVIWLAIVLLCYTLF